MCQKKITNRLIKPIRKPRKAEGLPPYEPDLLHGLLVDVALLCPVLSNDEKLAERGQQLLGQFPGSQQDQSSKYLLLQFADLKPNADSDPNFY